MGTRGMAAGRHGNNIGVGLDADWIVSRRGNATVNMFVVILINFTPILTLLESSVNVTTAVVLRMWDAP